MFDFSKNRLRRAALAALTLTVASCKARVPELDMSTARALLNETTHAGFSGLAFDDQCRLWGVPERETALIRFEVDGEKLSVAERIPIDGHPSGYDLESLAFADGRFYAGTEHLRPDRQSDPLLVIERSGDRATVISRIDFDYGAWGILASRNHGVEGLCVGGDYIVGAAELGLGTSKRKAPVAVYSRTSGELVKAFKVALTSETGKFSALDCNVKGQVIDLLAVERHYGVARLVRATLDLSRDETEIRSRVQSDLSTKVDPLPNFEGVALGPNGSTYLVTDNQSSTASGPTILFYGKSDEGLFATRRKEKR
ncbi:MAG: esterase-like activity of phytase family protein [Myxococcota bacterium]